MHLYKIRFIMYY